MRLLGGPGNLPDGKSACVTDRSTHMLGWRFQTVYVYSDQWCNPTSHQQSVSSGDYVHV